MGWGFVVTRRAVKRLDWAAAISFVALLAMSWSAIYALYTAAV
jgi:hypothetical protein